LKTQVIVLLAILCLVTEACGGSSVSDPAESVTKYLQAKVAGERETIRGLLCATMEADLDREALSFSGVEANIQDMQCQREDNKDIVACSGKIVAVYDGENTEFPLSRYNVVQEDGQWKWCGEAQ
jgi:hypothetical protein